MMPPDAVVVSDTSTRGGKPGDVVKSNSSFVNALLEEYLTPEEISGDALRSYYVDYYLAQMENGGFSQFVYNSEWRPEQVQFIREGLFAMKDHRHLELFQEGSRLIDRLGEDQLNEYFESDYFGENTCRDEVLRKSVYEV